MVNGPKDKPEGPLLITADPQNLHGCLQLGKLLGGPLLILCLTDSTYIQIKFPFELLIIRCLKVMHKHIFGRLTDPLNSKLKWDLSQLVGLSHGLLI